MKFVRTDFSTSPSFTWFARSVDLRVNGGTERDFLEDGSSKYCFSSRLMGEA